MTTNTTTANIIAEQSIENALFKSDAQRRRMIGRSNPYGMYNNMDRMWNAMYRVHTSSYLKSTNDNNVTKFKILSVGAKLEKMKISGPQYVTQEYERMVALMGQHFWVTTALMGIGTAVNSSGFGAAPGSLGVVEASVNLSRQLINAGLESVIHFANRYRWAYALSPDGILIRSTQGFGDSYKFNIGECLAARNVQGWKNWRLKVGGSASIGFTLNAAVAVGMNSAMLDDAIRRNDTTKIASYSLQLVSSLLNAPTNAAKAVAAFTGIPNAVQKTSMSRVAAGTGTAIGMFQALASIAAIAPNLANPNLSSSQKAAIGGEMVMQFGGGLALIGCDLYLAKLALECALNVTRSSAFVGFGAAAAALMVCLSPIQLQGLVDQNAYADSLDSVARQMREVGYDGDGVLADFYREKTGAEAGIVAVQNVLAIVGGVVSTVAAATGVGVPIAVATSLITGALSGIIGAVQQPIIEGIARKYAEKIAAAGGSQQYFKANIDGQYSLYKRDAKTTSALIELEDAFGVSSVVGVTTTQISKTALELAAITYNAANLKTAQTNIDRFVRGEVLADKTISIDSSQGNINVGGVSGTKQLVTFLTPLMAPGEEQRVRVSTGKDTYSTSLKVLFNGSGWVVNDGDASTTLDTRKIVTSLYSDDGKTLQKSLALTVNGGAGDDTVLANNSSITFDGGSGENSVSYMGLNTSDSRTGIVVTATATGFTVQKKLYDYQAYQEVTRTQDFPSGKRTETVAYRDFVLATIKGDGVVVRDNQLQ